MPRLFLDKWPPQRSCHVTRTRRDTSASQQLTDCATGDGRGRQEKKHSGMLLVLCLGCDLSLADRSELSLVFVDSDEPASLFVRNQTVPR